MDRVREGPRPVPVVVPEYSLSCRGMFPVLVTVTHRVSGASPGLTLATAEYMAVLLPSVRVTPIVPAAKVLPGLAVREVNAADAGLAKPTSAAVSRTAATLQMRRRGTTGHSTAAAPT